MIFNGGPANYKLFCDFLTRVQPTKNGGGQKKIIIFLGNAREIKSSGATIRIGQEILCLPCAEIFWWSCIGKGLGGGCAAWFFKYSIVVFCELSSLQTLRKYLELLIYKKSNSTYMGENNLDNFCKTTQNIPQG